MASVLIPLLRTQNHSLRNALSTANARQLFIPKEPYVGARWFCNQKDSENVLPEFLEVDKPKSVPVNVAYQFFQSGYHYLDVRTLDEFKGGHIPNAINIPYQFQTQSGMSTNPKFLEEVSAHFKRDDGIIVGCRSGKRSLMAATELKSAGFTRAIDVAGGYISWSDEGFPTTE